MSTKLRRRSELQAESVPDPLTPGLGRHSQAGWEEQEFEAGQRVTE